jgi:2'-5' RNA ligase
MSKKDSSFRLFTGIALPLQLCRQLQALQEGLAGVRLTAPDNFHITLSFIGNVEPALAEDIDEVLSGIRAPQFPLTVKGTGYFSGGQHLHHLWMGLEHSEALHHLKEKIDRGLGMRQLPVEKRKYTPHITIAGLKLGDEELAAAFMQRHNLFVAAPFDVREFILYRSHQDSEGALYEEMAAYPLY